MTAWQYDVAVTTHELLQLGVTEAQRVRVEVEADTELEASQIAIQMGFIVGYATDCAYVE